MTKLKVGLLMGGMTEESYLSIRSAQRIFEAYNREKYDFFAYECQPGGTWIEYPANSLASPARTHASAVAALAQARVDLFFVSFHGDTEGDGRLAGLMDLMGLKYTGNGFFPSFAGMNKLVAKLFFQHMGLLTPRFLVIDTAQAHRLSDLEKETAEKIGFPCVIKPEASGSSIGLELLRSPEDFRTIAPPILAAHQSVLLEEFIRGTEYSIGVMGRFDREVEVLPIARIQYPDEFFDKKCKYEDTYQVIVPTEIPPDIERQLQDISRAIHVRLRFEGCSRTDIIVRDGQCYVLEVNTHPGLGGHSIFPAMMKAKGMTYSELIDRLIAWSMDRPGAGQP